ncbi:MAG: signal peptidase I [Candidatus Thiodiazotropha sp. (ex Lucinoma aequizonata)]|nr:signal peptidase I [Candidatus Thiodiazotropha sp. (ex Lucinoma aequizonata)]MCU7887387.1 signal peptidase I [Candidatus Thiodiazotropha sp. (ex Lucinoma aequizonata)]MCU7895861.1 signal peptidase I [Candidatus Thiodiazotropha sp. (ex Lucinoma aequizonata)]MCU7900157.1 signal peptidase I [Candidatus Thiodiazotropha sp. (ex Lucinoma aequizonata)]MCU7904147.1 signal peptidase I [Candidatus Thiodiazotropha sp. (ex Lucinoma aequizonata)]
MNFIFPVFLVVVSALTGGIWLLDSIFLAPKRRQLVTDGGGEPAQTPTVRKKPLIVVGSRFVFPVIFLALIIRSFLVEPFRIPSGSMMPTLLVGDFILVNKFSYGIRLPVLNKKIIDLGDPQRGDPIVFRYPDSPRVDFIKRVVGVPGDTIYYRGKTLYVNGDTMPQTSLGRYAGVGSGKRMSGVITAVENLDGREHSILINPLAPDLSIGCDVLRQGQITIPDGHYFVMGDNRDNSNDSRCWGLVPEENLVGRAFGIWMNWDSEIDNFPPIGWERIGKGID